MNGFSYTYVLKCVDSDELYIGSTEDLERRIKQHKNGLGGFTTAKKRIDLIYFEACRSIAEARKREKQLKTGFGRAYLNRRLAFEMNPGSRD